MSLIVRSADILIEKILNSMTRNDEIFTNLLVVQEVTQRLLSELIDDNDITHELKQDFNLYIRYGDKFRNSWLKKIRDRFGEEGVEFHESDADMFYNLFNSMSKLRTHDQMVRANALVSNIANEIK